MKKTITILISMLIAFSFIFSVNAEGTSNIYNINGKTVEFLTDSSFTNEQQLIIANCIANDIDNSSVATYNLLCTMFGHKTTTETITVIEHCVSDTAPRCLRTFQDVTACSRCDYVYVEVIGSSYIFCCD
ncbi:MAG: hypothetical protein IJB43_00455 [Clostridia bacterium]|nr:hypothetical protein [Clostridia bacterium]